jgi:GT2 family glycosyltransferase
MKKTKPKSVSVIFPTLNRDKVLVNSVKDVLKQKYPDFEIIIIDQSDNPEKETLDFFKKHKDKIKYFHIDKKSLPHARNIGAKISRSDILLFLDDDIEIKDDHFINYHTENFNDKKIALVGGRVVYDFNKIPKVYKEVGKMKSFGLKEITNFDSLKKMEIDHAPGGNFTVLRKIYFQVGGFDEKYIGSAHKEETDFCLRVKKAGFKLIYEPGAAMKHLQFSSGGCRVGDIYISRYWFIRNYTYFYLKNYPKILFPIYFIKQLIWAMAASIKRGEKKMFNNMLSALTDGYKYYNNAQKEVD